MHIKFLAHGTGDPQRASAYLLGMRDHNGDERAGVHVLRGNPELVAHIAASLTTVHRYTSGVISWATDDEPSDKEIDEVLTDFERTAFAGLEPEQYCWSAIQHVQADGSTHVHVFAARVEVSTGKALNIAPPGWKKTFDPLRDYWNHRSGWSRPDDPARARPMQPGRMASANKAVGIKNAKIVDKVRAEGCDSTHLQHVLEVEPDPKRWIEDFLMTRLRSGEIRSRADLLDALREIGELNRVGNDYVSLRIQGRDKPLRLKGALFMERLDVEAVCSPCGKHGRSDPDLSAAQAAKVKLDAAIERRAAYNRARFPAPAPRPAPKTHSNPSSAHESADNQATKIEVTDDRNRNPLLGDAEKALRAARSAIARFIRACRTAVHSFGTLERANRAIDQASRATEQASRAAQRAVSARQELDTARRRGAARRPGVHR